VTVTPGIGWGIDSAVMMRPVTAVVPGARTSSEKLAVRVTLCASTDATPVTVSWYTPGATSAPTVSANAPLPPGASSAGVSWKLFWSAVMKVRVAPYW
jgi:hypothetical protein